MVPDSGRGASHIETSGGTVQQRLSGGGQGVTAPANGTTPGSGHGTPRGSASNSNSSTTATEDTTAPLHTSPEDKEQAQQGQGGGRGARENGPSLGPHAALNKSLNDR